MTTGCIAPNTERTEPAVISAFMVGYTDCSQPTQGPSPRKCTHGSSSACRSQDDSQEARPWGSTSPTSIVPGHFRARNAFSGLVLCLVTESKGYHTPVIVLCPVLLHTVQPHRSSVPVIHVFQVLKDSNWLQNPILFNVIYNPEENFQPQKIHSFINALERLTFSKKLFFP